jgi:hypothetical protein
MYDFSRKLSILDFVWNLEFGIYLCIENCGLPAPSAMMDIVVNHDR